MPTMSGRVSLAAGASSGNVLLGQQYELAPFDGTIEVGIVADKNLVTCSVFSGPDILQQPGGLVPVGTLDAPPKYPDDYHWEDEVAKGDRLALIIVNGNAATTVATWVVRITPS